ncbi:MAG TPA: hypothetical protein VHD15_11025 [Hyphomicrobiales bacterium]|nr:hypothetical protein [Hyphomicrobiales bacterium]
MKQVTKRVARKAKAQRTVAGYQVLGTTKDGVRILKPKKPATHFTTAEIRRAIRSVLAAERAG